MTRFKILCGVALLFSLLLIGGAIATNIAGASSIPPKKPPVTPNPNAMDMSQSSIITGVPAIPVNRSLAASNSSTPAFTRDDVKAFLNKHGFYAGPVVQGAQLKILSIQFITAKQASDLMKGESIGVPDDYLVCYVKVQGPFQLTNAELPRGASAIANTGDVVFNAHTGNMLVWGVY